MTGVIVNTITVILGTILGLTFRSKIPQKVTNAVMTAVGLCTVYIGISGSLAGQNTVVLIICMALGTIAGTVIDIDNKLNKFGVFVSDKFKSKNSQTTSLSEGFVTASLLFCVGSMTIVGGLNAGLSGDNTMYFTKAVLDFISATMLSATLGIGVVLAGFTVFFYQGAIVLLAKLISPFLTEFVIAELNCAGSLMIFALGLNIVGISKFKVANFLPALVFVPFVCWIVERLGV